MNITFCLDSGKTKIVVSVLFFLLFGAMTCQYKGSSKEEYLQKKVQCLRSYLQNEELKRKCQFKCRMEVSIGCSDAHQKCLEKELARKICRSF